MGELDTLQEKGRGGRSSHGEVRFSLVVVEILLVLFVLTGNRWSGQTPQRPFSTLQQLPVRTSSDERPGSDSSPCLYPWISDVPAGFPLQLVRSGPCRDSIVHPDPGRCPAHPCAALPSPMWVDVAFFDWSVYYVFGGATLLVFLSSTGFWLLVYNGGSPDSQTHYPSHTYCWTLWILCGHLWCTSVLCLLLVFITTTSMLPCWCQKNGKSYSIIS